MKIIISEKYEIQYQSPNTSECDKFWSSDDRCPKVKNLAEGKWNLIYNQDIERFRAFGCKFRLIKVTEEIILSDIKCE